MNEAASTLVERARALGAQPGGEVPSPCTGVCRIEPDTGWCAGCFRTIDEITAWRALADDDRRAVWARIERRAAGALEDADS